MDLPISYVDDIMVVRLSDELLLKGSSTSELRDTLLELIERRACRALLIDLGAVSDLSSLGASMLVSVRLRLEDQGGKLALVHVRPGIKKFFTLTKLITVFRLFESVDDALASLAGVSDCDRQKNARRSG